MLCKLQRLKEKKKYIRGKGVWNGTYVLMVGQQFLSWIRPLLSDIYIVTTIL